MYPRTRSASGLIPPIARFERRNRGPRTASAILPPAEGVTSAAPWVTGPRERGHDGAFGSVRTLQREGVAALAHPGVWSLSSSGRRSYMLARSVVFGCSPPLAWSL